MANGEKPAKKFRLGYLTATVWKNDKYHSVEVTRSYKNDQSEWQETTSMSEGDLLNAAKLYQRCETWIADQRE